MASYRIKELRESKKVSQERLADAVGISFSQISRFESGDREPRVSELLKIAQFLGIPWPEFVEDGAASAATVPLISWVSAGALSVPREVIDAENARMVQVADLPSGSWFALAVDGDSMDRISPPGSVILVNRRDKRLVPNACYIIDDGDGGATYKRYRTNPMRFEPVSTNAAHEPIYPDQEPKIIGRVKRTILDM